MHYFGLFDYGCRWLFIDSTSPGFQFEPSDLIGLEVWRVPGANECDTDLQRLHQRIVERQEAPAPFGVHWKLGETEYWYQAKITWVGHESVAYSLLAWQFPAKMRLLSAREREFLAAYGRHGVCTLAADSLRIQRSTGRTHLQRARQKLGMTRAELAILAVKFSFMAE